MNHHRRPLLGLVVAFVLLVGACGDDDTGSAASDTGSAASDTGSAGDGDQADGNGATTDDHDASPSEGDPTEESAAELAEELTSDLEDVQASQGGGSATLTVGDQTWEFDSVLCAIGEEQTGQEGAEFVLSSLQDGLQFYVSIDRFGHSVSLDDIEDFEDPSVGLASVDEDFIVVDGTTVSGEAVFADTTADDLSTTPGSFRGTCP